METEAAPEDQDRVLLERLPDPRAASTSFLRANKPTWRILLDRHEPPLSPEAEDAIADSEAAIAVIRLDLAGRLPRSRREVLLASLAWAVAEAGLSGAERRALHERGYRWAVDNGRWDAVATDGIESRFVEQAQDLARFVEAARCGEDGPFGGPDSRRALAGRWRGRATAARLPRALEHHANRLGVHAEPAAILHYFLWRLTGARP